MHDLHVEEERMEEMHVQEENAQVHRCTSVCLTQEHVHEHVGGAQERVHEHMQEHVVQEHIQEHTREEGSVTLWLPCRQRT